MEDLSPSKQNSSLEHSESALIENCRGETQVSPAGATSISTGNEYIREIPRLMLAREQRRNRQLADQKLGQNEDMNTENGFVKIDTTNPQEFVQNDNNEKKNQAFEETHFNPQELSSQPNSGMEGENHSEDKMHEEAPSQMNGTFEETMMNESQRSVPAEEFADSNMMKDSERNEDLQNENTATNTNTLESAANPANQEEASMFEFPVAVFTNNSDMMEEENSQSKQEGENKDTLPLKPSEGQTNQAVSKNQNILPKKTQNNNSKKLNIPNRFSTSSNLAKKDVPGRSLSRKSEATTTKPAVNARPITPVVRNNSRTSIPIATKVNSTTRPNVRDQKLTDRNKSSLSARAEARSDSTKQKSLTSGKSNTSFTLPNKPGLQKSLKVLPKPSNPSKPVQSTKRPRDQIAKSVERDPSENKENVNLNSKKPKLSLPLKINTIPKPTISRLSLQDNKLKPKVAAPTQKENLTKSGSTTSLLQKGKQSTTERTSGRFGRPQNQLKEVSVGKANKPGIQSKGSSTDRARSSSGSVERKSVKENFAVPKQKNPTTIVKKVNVSTTPRTSTSGTPTNRSGNCGICQGSLKGTQSRMLACLHKVHTDCFIRENKKKPGCPVCNGTIKALQNQALPESKKAIHA